MTLYIERKIACLPEDMNKKICPIIEYMEITVIPDTDGKIGTYLAPNYMIDENFHYKYSV